MAADQESTPDAHRAAPLAPLPDHHNVDTPWWQELWHRHAHITTPLRERGLECDIDFGLSAYIVRVSLPDDSYLIIGPPQEPPSDRPPGSPEGWIATREHPDDPSLFEVLYDSVPSDEPGAPDRPETRHGGSAQPLVEAIDHRLDQLGLLPTPSSPTARTTVSATEPTLRTPKPRDVSGNADRTFVYGDVLLVLTDRLNATESPTDAAAMLHQILDPTSGLLERLGEFFEAAAEKAKEFEQDDGFDLHYDLQDAAATLRSLGEDLHTAVDRMRALAPARRTTRTGLPPGPSPGPPTATTPMPGRTR
ncbi:hypothetical protein [Streptomyces scabiei]|uniref:hypothetical protein n=1 Tax=Streptomyces scabiei TaxID=1930 RepID=UPI0007749E4A|nr:hypothetical protein [Streptomyces scabiei]